TEELEQRLRETEAARLRLDEAAKARATETKAASARIAELESATAADAAARERVAQRTAALEGELEVLRANAVVSITTPDDQKATASGGLRLDRREDAGGDLSWRLVLARIERQWADAVNAGPDERGVIDASSSEQLAQAVARDLERLREEVGVQTTLAPARSDGVIDPLTTLLAVGEAVALLAYHSEHVLVDLHDEAVVTGEDWTGDDDAVQALERLVATASAGGVPAAVAVVDHVARVTLGARG
ncbi:MAG: hypothetical protein M3Z46_13735, partial [Actinomycetota bacterium]|nr:hypothetical protein [Actinomycetota bacterium]